MTVLRFGLTPKMKPVSPRRAAVVAGLDIGTSKVVFKFLPDAAAAVAALKAGDVQVLAGISPTALSAVRESSNIRVISQRSWGFEAIVFNIGNSNGVGNLPYANVGTIWSTRPNLRRAFEEAIDRNTLNRVLFGGAMSPAARR